MRRLTKETVELDETYVEQKLIRRMTKALPYSPVSQSVLARKRYKFGLPETMDLRRKCITATDVSSIVHLVPGVRGDNKYRNAERLFRQKLEIESRPSTNPAMEHGLKYENEALDVYSIITGNAVFREIGFIKSQDAKYNFIGATPDAICINYPVLVEIKCPFWHIPVPWKLDQVPDIYYPQVQLQMFVTGIRLTHFVRYKPQTLLKPGKIQIQEVAWDSEWFSKAWPHICNFYRQMRAVQNDHRLFKRLKEEYANKKVKRNKRHKVDTENTEMRVCIIKDL